MREVLSARLRSLKSDSLVTFEARSRLGAALVVTAVLNGELSANQRNAQLTKAEDLLLQNQRRLEQEAEPRREHFRDSLARLERLCDVWGKAEKRAEWQQRLVDFVKSKAQGAREPGAN